MSDFLKNLAYAAVGILLLSLGLGITTVFFGTPEEIAGINLLVGMRFHTALAIIALIGFPLASVVPKRQRQQKIDPDPNPDLAARARSEASVRRFYRERGLL